MERLELVFKAADGTVDRVIKAPPPGNSLTMGRMQGCDVVFIEPFFSRNHALLRVDPDGSTWLVPLASDASLIKHNAGDTVRNTPVRLQEGDTIALVQDFPLAQATVRACANVAPKRACTPSEASDPKRSRSGTGQPNPCRAERPAAMALLTGWPPLATQPDIALVPHCTGTGLQQIGTTSEAATAAATSEAATAAAATSEAATAAAATSEAATAAAAAAATSEAATAAAATSAAATAAAATSEAVTAAAATSEAATAAAATSAAATAAAAAAATSEAATAAAATSAAATAAAATSEAVTAAAATNGSTAADTVVANTAAVLCGSAPRTALHVRGMCGWHVCEYTLTRARVHRADGQAAAAADSIEASAGMVGAKESQPDSSDKDAATATAAVRVCVMFLHNSWCRGAQACCMQLACNVHAAYSQCMQRTQCMQCTV